MHCTPCKALHPAHSSVRSIYPSFSLLSGLLISGDGNKKEHLHPGYWQSYQVPQYCCSYVWCAVGLKAIFPCSLFEQLGKTIKAFRIVRSLQACGGSYLYSCAYNVCTETDNRTPLRFHTVPCSRTLRTSAARWRAGRDGSNLIRLLPMWHMILFSSRTRRNIRFYLLEEEIHLQFVLLLRYSKGTASIHSLGASISSFRSALRSRIILFS